MAIIVSQTTNPISDEKKAALIKSVADSLGVLPKDVVLLPAGVTVSVVDVPDDLIKSRDKQEAHDKHEAEKKAKEEAAAAAEAQKAAEAPKTHAAHAGHSHKDK